jgi:Uma2 family endonuclease
MAEAVKELAARTQRLTAEEFAALGDLGPCELIKGEIVTMSPTRRPHGRRTYRIARIVGDYVEAQDLGEVYVGEVGVQTERGEDTVRGADLAFCPWEDVPNEEEEQAETWIMPPALVVEVVSRHDTPRDLRKKVQEYLQVGVRQVWVVDERTRTVQVHRADGTTDILTETATLAGEDVLPGFTVPVADLFQRRRRRKP